MSIYTLGRKLKRSNLWGMRKLVNLCYYDPATVILTARNFDVVEVDGCRFAMNDQVDSVMRVKDNPWFEGIKPDDVVLDIGANIGAVSIPLAKSAKVVYAVEPLFINELQNNIVLNDLDNVIILPFGLGEKFTKIKVSFGPREGVAEMKTLAEIKELIGEPIDFLKCDCEGAEWLIKPEELGGIREMRFEFHIRRNKEKQDYIALANWYKWLDANGYKRDISKGEQPGPVVPFSQCILMIASKKDDVH